jgi:hypothetical protein
VKIRFTVRDSFFRICATGRELGIPFCPISESQEGAMYPNVESRSMRNDGEVRVEKTTREQRHIPAPGFANRR